MKATINGITYEGTPEEISAMLLIQQAHSRNKPFKQPCGFPADWLVRFPKQTEAITRTTTGTDIQFKVESVTAIGQTWDGHWRN